MAELREGVIAKRGDNCAAALTTVLYLILAADPRMSGEKEDEADASSDAGA